MLVEEASSVENYHSILCVYVITKPREAMLMTQYDDECGLLASSLRANRLPRRLPACITMTPVLAWI